MPYLDLATINQLLTRPFGFIVSFDVMTFVSLSIMPEIRQRDTFRASKEQTYKNGSFDAIVEELKDTLKKSIQN